MHLVSGNTRYGVVRGADFGGIVRECGNVVACERGSVGKKGSRQLHSVSAVSSKTDDDVVNFLDLIFC